MHRSHEYLAKVAIEICDGVLVHSLLGNLKPGDIPADVRTRAIGTLIDKYFVPGTVVQAGYPLDMRYAGPREALLHAVFRQNYGCAYQIVGRDHAGVGSYYGPFDAHHIFDEIPQDALEIQPMKIDWTFWCYACGGMASGAHLPARRRRTGCWCRARSCASGSRKAARVPPEFSRPEVLDDPARVLREHCDDDEQAALGRPRFEPGARAVRQDLRRGTPRRAPHFILAFRGRRRGSSRRIRA